MNIVYTLYYRYSLMVMVNLGALLFCTKLPRRKWFWLSLILGLIINIIFSWAMDHFFQNFRRSDNLFLQCLVFLAQYLFAFLLVYSTFDCKPTSALFCATCGYCLQQIASRITNMIPGLFDAKFPTWSILLIYLFSGAVVYTLSFFLFKKKKGDKALSVKNPIHLVIMTFALIVMIFIEQLMIPTIFAIEDRFVFAANFVSSIIFAALILLLEFNLLSNEEYRSELDILKQIALKEREQYQLEKAAIDTINIKSHDLKHQLNALDGRIDAAEIDKIRSAVDIYDSAFKMGNAALDVVLTMKGLVCKNKNIELTALLDGRALSFISDADIYSLFGNILDNAIEAVEKIEDEGKRVISLTMSSENSILFIRAENYFDVAPVFVDGLPQTTKEEKNYHGFGLKSIRMIAESYGGDCLITAENGAFILDLMFMKEEMK